MTAGPILVIGKTGQVAGALAAEARRTGRDLVIMGRPDADLTDRSSLARAIDRHRPRFVINAGAYTDLDRAEGDGKGLAYAINADGPAALATLCAGAETPLLHLSTDCVFDGTKSAPYTEDDDPCPVSVYGASKRAGEQAVAEAGGPHFIVRVSWVFSHHAGSFVRTMLNLARTRDAVRVVDDQVGHPTHAADLARALFATADAASWPDFGGWGLFHVAGSDPIDRAGQARAIFAASAALGGPTATVEPVSSAAFGAAATRPPNARLDASRASQRFALTFGHWRDQTRDTVAALLAGTA